MTRKSITVLASGGGTDLQSILDAIDLGLIENAAVTCVVSDRADAGALNRGDKAGAHAAYVAPVAKAEGGRPAHEAAIIREIHEAGGADLVVLAGYMRILGPDIVERFQGKLINIHPALLPAYPGADGPGDALAGGAQISGCTTHFVDIGVDTGPIILQAAVPVLPDDDRARLHARILAAEHQILPRTVDLCLLGEAVLQGNRATIRPGSSWKGRVPELPGVLYPAAF